MKTLEDIRAKYPKINFPRKIYHKFEGTIVRIFTGNFDERFFISDEFGYLDNVLAMYNYFVLKNEIKSKELFLRSINKKHYPAMTNYANIFCSSDKEESIRLHKLAIEHGDDRTMTKLSLDLLELFDDVPI